MRTIHCLPEKFNNPLDDIPDWLLDELYKVQAAWGVPVRILIIDQLENFIADNWDLETDSPRKTRWEKELRKTKPRGNRGFVAVKNKLSRRNY